jgi:Protein of unknown function (DUF2380)
MRPLFSAGLFCLMFLNPAFGKDKMAVFEFEILRSNDVPGVPGQIEAEDQRLGMITERLRSLLSGLGKFDLVDTDPVAQKAASANLQSCGNCADGFALELGAAYSVTGRVQKISELILNVNVHVRRAASARLVAVATVDLRGNTDESWRRAIDYLFGNILSPQLQKLAD